MAAGKRKSTSNSQEENQKEVRENGGKEKKKKLIKRSWATKEVDVMGKIFERVAETATRFSVMQRLPVTKNNLELVTSIVWLEGSSELYLLVERDPSSPLEHELLDLFGTSVIIKRADFDIINTMRRMLEVITGQTFVSMDTGSGRGLHYRRLDFHQKILALEKKGVEVPDDCGRGPETLNPI